MVSVYLNGRLGNQLFQYVSLRIVAEKYSTNFYIPKNVDESITFYKKITNILFINLELPVETNPHYWIGCDIFDINFGYDDGSICKISNECNSLDEHQDGSFLYGFFQNEKNLKDRRSDIKKWLCVKNDILNDKCNHILEKYNPNNYCYIHFRGGDYKSIDKYFLPLTYYTRSMDKMKSDYPNIKFLIITDDIETSRELFKNYDIDSISNEMCIDFYLLYKSVYSIIPNSSFSWWGIWLSDSNIRNLAPYGWFNYNDCGDFEPKYIKSDRFEYVKNEKYEL